MSPIRRKLVVVGDGNCGKTSLLVVYQERRFPEQYVPTVFENYIANVTLDNGKVVELALWDTAGQEDFDRLRPLSYPETAVVLICFSVDNYTSFVNVQDRWLPEINHFLPDVPKLLVATKIDLRDCERKKAEVRAGGREMITYEEGERLAKEIGAKYHECSAKLNQNVDEVILAATRAAMTGGMSRYKKLCNIL